MSLLKSPLRIAAAALAALSLGACVTVFPETKPVQLYRFDAPQAPAAGPAASEPVGVFKGRTEFGRAVAGDRILTITGQEAAYIADARWVAPASILFDEALGQAFADNPGRARLAVRSEIARAPYFLRLDVRNFEAVYENGPRSAPTVVVRVRAVMTRSADRTLVGDETIETRVRAADNRVSAIVQAFDQAAGENIAALLEWTNARAEPVPPT
jgi:cholesterol transport system auxiliary component